MFFVLLFILPIIYLIIYFSIKKEINKRRIRKEDALLNLKTPKTKIKTLDTENKKITYDLKLLIIGFLFLCCILSFFVGKKIENKIISTVLTTALANHNEYYGEKYKILNISIEKTNYLVVNIIITDLEKKYVEKHAFNSFGVWQGCDIIYEIK